MTLTFVAVLFLLVVTVNHGLRLRRLEHLSARFEHWGEFIEIEKSDSDSQR